MKVITAKGAKQSLVVRPKGSRHPCPLSLCSIDFPNKTKLLQHIYNAHGATVGLDKNSVDRLGCSLDLDNHLLVCVNASCGHALDPKTMVAHLQGHNITLEASELEELVGKLSVKGCEGFAIALKGPHLPVAGVAVDLKGYYCPFPGCMLAFDSRQSLKSHCLLDHDSKRIDELFERGPYQHVFGKEHVGTQVINAMTDGEESYRLMHIRDIVPVSLYARPQTASPLSRLLIESTGWGPFLDSLDTRNDLAIMAHSGHYRLTSNQMWLKNALDEECELLTRSLSLAIPLVMSILQKG